MKLGIDVVESGEEPVYVTQVVSVALLLFIHNSPPLAGVGHGEKKPVLCLH